MPSLMSTRVAAPKLPLRERGGVPRSQVERAWLVGGGLVAFVMLLIGYFFFISPQRSSTADVKGQVATAKQQNAVLQGRIDALDEQNKNIDKYLAELAAARLALPSTSGIPDFLRTLQALGNATHTEVTALSVAPPAPLTRPAAAQPTAEATGTESATPSPAPTTSAAGSVPGAPGAGTYALPISATVMGSSAELIKFLDQLQAVQPRAVLITQITEGAAQQSTSTGQPSTNLMSLQLTMDAFVAPGAPALSASPSAGSS